MKMVTHNFYASPRDIDSVISVCLKIGQENLLFFNISALFNFNQNIVKCCLNSFMTEVSIIYKPDH